ncbi:MAG: hypothetical protein M0R46_11980 [Candidatus Muirbacterium halophilum]|nr:hypothetical protein [Candidatus Muirbacterium halophilum]MCK9476634.1 hypothetical protein [Candidatus Muirbacterium halophilum]
MEDNNNNKTCKYCSFFEKSEEGYGYCKCTDANGYDLVVSEKSSCDSFKEKNDKKD